MTEEQPTEQKFDAVIARQLLLEEQAKRETACAAAIQAILAEHGCNLFPVPRLTPDGRIIALVEIRSIKA